MNDDCLNLIKNVLDIDVNGKIIFIINKTADMSNPYYWEFPQKSDTMYMSTIGFLFLLSRWFIVVHEQTSKILQFSKA
jgi:hypothetical protein